MLIDVLAFSPLLFFAAAGAFSAYLYIQGDERQRWRIHILATTYLAYAGYYLTRKAFTICKTSIAGEFNIGLDATGHIWTAFLIAYMVGQFVSSYLGRKHGARLLLLTGLGISMGVNALCGIANSFPTLMVFMIINGFAQATGWPGAVGGIAYWVAPQERGRIMGWWSTSYAVGNVLVKTVGGFLLGMYGWRWSFVGLTLLTLLIWLYVYLRHRNRPEDVGLEPFVEEDAERLQAVRTAQGDRITLGEYLRLMANPLILVMGFSYFCIKFLRYALDSWLPAFLNVQGMNVAHASYYSQIFDVAGLVGVIAAGYALDKLFRGNWALLCLVLGVGMTFAYYGVLLAGNSPVLLALCYGLVGFMLYGPDTLLGGAAAVQVAGEKNGVAVAGIVNGLASLGPVVQEQVIAWLVRGHVEQGMRNTNLLAFTMSAAFTLMMVVAVWRLHRAHEDDRREMEKRNST